MKLSDKAKAVIDAVVPTLGAALGGPLGGMAGQVIAAAVGGKTDKDVDAAILGQKPETLLALKQGERDFQVKMKELEIEDDKLFLQDKASARDLAKVDMRPQIILSAVFVIGYFAVLAALIGSVFELSPTQQALVNTLMGVLAAGVIKILDFWFGSSHGSQQKNQMLYNSTPKGE